MGSLASLVSGLIEAVNSISATGLCALALIVALVAVSKAK